MKSGKHFSIHNEHATKGTSSHDGKPPIRLLLEVVAEVLTDSIFQIPIYPITRIYPHP